MKNPLLSIPALLIAAMLITSCEAPRSTSQGAKYGAIIGGGIGALTTGDLRGALRGAAIGAGTGAVVGAVNRDDRYDDRRYRDDRYRDARYRGDRRRHRDYDDRRYSRVPVAHPTRHRGYVRSPYSPNHLIDVRGIPSGARVLDPSNERIFINP